MFKTEIVQEYKGYVLVCNFLDMGHRCGYVGLPKNHPIERISVSRADKLFGVCHGGVSYSEPTYNHYPIYNPEVAWWIGFDCNHYADGKDMESVEYYFGKEVRKEAERLSGQKVNSGKHIYDKNEVIQECMKLADEIEKVISKDKENEDKDYSEMERN